MVHFYFLSFNISPSVKCTVHMEIRPFLRSFSHNKERFIKLINRAALEVKKDIDNYHVLVLSITIIKCFDRKVAAMSLSWIAYSIIQTNKGQI
jgi:hypothetical protein